jgi:hypothetical protein
MTNPDSGPYAPSVFIVDYQLPDGGTIVIPPMPRSSGGIIESVKTSLMEAILDAVSGVTLFQKGQKVFVSLDYPLIPVHYPGIWVQFSLTKLNRAGMGHEVPVQDDNTGNWSFIQEWTFEATATLTVVALDSITRDRISDALIMTLAFARTPQLSATKPQADTKQNRSLITALDENPYVALTLNTDTITPGGESASMGTPWQDDVLTYENNFSIGMLGQFNIAFTNDGLYTLARIDPNFTVSATAQGYEPQQWLDNIPHPPYGSGPYPGGSQNPANVDYPVL